MAEAVDHSTGEPKQGITVEARPAEAEPMEHPPSRHSTPLPKPSQTLEMGA